MLHKPLEGKAQMIESYELETAEPIIPASNQQQRRNRPTDGMLPKTLGYDSSINASAVVLLVPRPSTRVSNSVEGKRIYSGNWTNILVSDAHLRKRFWD